MKDKRELEITTSSEECIEAINLFEDGFLAYTRDNINFLRKAVEADSNCAYAITISAIFSIFEGEMQKAQQKLDKSRTLQKNNREILYYYFAVSLRHGNVTLALNYNLTLSKSYPHDIFNMKLGQVMCLISGNRKDLLTVTDPYLSISSFTPIQSQYRCYFLGMRSFGEIENGRFEEGLKLSQEGTNLSLQFNKLDPWSHHSVAHAFEELGEFEKGISFLEPITDLWADRNPFMKHHNWWHLSLFYLDRSDISEVMKLYPTYILPYEDTSDTNVVTGAMSLLSRCEFRGVSVVEKWEEVRSFIDIKKMKMTPFTDLHFLYALAKVGDNERVDEYLNDLENNQHHFRSGKQRDVFEHVVRGVVAHARSDFETSYSYLSTSISSLYRIGGSNAQQDLWVQMYMDTLQQTKRWSELKECLSQRVEVRKNVPFYYHLLSKSSQHLNDHISSEIYSQKCNDLLRLYSTSLSL